MLSIILYISGFFLVVYLLKYFYILTSSDRAWAIEARKALSNRHYWLIFGRLLILAVLISSAIRGEWHIAIYFSVVFGGIYFFEYCYMRGLSGKDKTDENVGTKAVWPTVIRGAFSTRFYWAFWSLLLVSGALIWNEWHMRELIKKENILHPKPVDPLYENILKQLKENYWIKKLKN